MQKAVGRRQTIEIGDGFQFKTDMKTYGTRQSVANYNLKGVIENAWLS